MASYHLSIELIERIKERAWHGEPASSIAYAYEVSTVHITMIIRGTRWPDIKWPDGSTGALSKKRRREISQARQDALPYYHKKVRQLLTSSKEN